MMERVRGCFRNVLAAVGCVTVLAVGSVAGWQYRAQLGDAYRWAVARVRGAVGDVAADTGRPTAAGRRSAERKEAAIARQGGPAYVVLTASELAALIQDRLDPAARIVLDSLQVALDEGRVAVLAQVRTDRLSAVVQGPVADLLGPRQPVVLSGPVSIARPGRLVWTPEEAEVRGFPLPRAATARLVDHVTGGTDGMLIITVPEAVGDVRVRADGITFYRRVD